MSRRPRRSGTSRRAVSLSSHFRPFLGLPAWNVALGLFNFLTLEFGKPHLHVREPIRAAQRRLRTARELLARRTVHVHGDWHLWIYCCDWRVLKKRARIGSNASLRSAERAAHELQGQKFVRVTLRRTGCTRFTFDLGGVLETRPWRRGQHDRQWLLFDPRGKVLVLRGDGMCSYHSAKTLPRIERWRRAR